ncbi:MAG: DUF5684 domain-containing protein [Lachnospiraceae bacterium]|jgi:hypothetical protein|nr:DUF5684 domain-containing protein [Lachnospiraceae bacterium]
MSNLQIIVSLVIGMFRIPIAIWILVCLAKIFIKFGVEWWKAIIPFYDLVILYKKVSGSGWVFLIQFIPLLFIRSTVLFNIASVIIALYTWARLAIVFGKKSYEAVGYTVGLLLLCPVFIGILAFGKAEYVGVYDTVANEEENTQAKEVTNAEQTIENKTEE